jgi:hypothetical protein
VTPQLNDVLLGVLVLLLSHVQALEDFRDVTHVEHVVRVGWSWQELLLNVVEECNSCNSKILALSLDVLRELLEFVFSKCLEDALHVIL